MLSEEKKEIEEAVSIILRGIDIESSALILEKAIMDNYIISTGRVNILRIATRQILNFIEEYKNKGYLDVVREKVKANEEISKLQKEIELQKEKRENQKVELTILNEKQKEMNKLINDVKSYKGQFIRQEREIRDLQKENEKKVREYIQHLEQKESILDKVTDKLKEVGNKYIKEYKDVEKLDLIQQNTAVLQELSCVIDDIEDILKLIEGEKK